MTSHDLANDLAALAEQLNAQPPIPLPYKASLYFGSYGEKEPFIALAKAMPRPFVKTVTPGLYPTIELRHEGTALTTWVRAPRSLVCHIVKPAQEAEYECEPLFSADEERQMESVQP